MKTNGRPSRPRKVSDRGSHLGSTEGLDLVPKPALDKYEFMDLAQLKEELRRRDNQDEEIALYEVTNGVAGKGGYIRVYVWERSLGAALVRAFAEFQMSGIEVCRNIPLGKLRALKLFTRDAEPFSSFPSDQGFATKGVRIPNEL